MAVQHALGQQPDQNQHPDHGHVLRVAPGPRCDAALPCRGRQQAQRLAQYLDVGRGVAIRPAAGTWTTFDLPTRGTEARHISLLENDGKTQVVIPYSRTSKVAVMTFRTESDLAALKAEAERP